jgi:nicotinamidase-related amidase
MFRTGKDYETSINGHRHAEGVLRRADERPDGPRDGDINYVIPMFEKKGLPIIWVQDKDEGEGVVPGKEGFEFIDSLKPKTDDIRIHKTYGNSFNKTDVDKILKEAGVDTVVMTGFCAEFWCLSTYRGAKDLDYFPVI